VKAGGTALDVLRALELGPKGVRSPAWVVVDATAIALTVGSEDELHELLAGIAPLRDQLEYGSKVASTPLSALTDKLAGRAFEAGAWWAVASSIGAVARLRTSQRPVRPTTGVLVELGLWRLLQEEEAPPSVLQQRLQTRGLATSQPTISKRLRVLRGLGVVDQVFHPVDRRLRLYRVSPAGRSDDADGGLEDLREDLQTIALDGDHESETRAAAVVSVVNEIGRLVADAVDLTSLVAPIEDTSAALGQGSPDDLLAPPPGADPTVTSEPFLAGALWGLSDLIDAMVSRRAATRERRAAKASRGEVRKIVLEVAARGGTFRPADVMRELHERGVEAQHEQVSPAISDLVTAGKIVSADAPPHCTDNRRRYYRSTGGRTG
jgi:DNA-binding transcriptional ArsR family regulator